MSRVPAALALVMLGLNLLALPRACAAEAALVVGSKTFPESYLLAELMAQTLEAADFAVRRQFGFGGTLVCYEALRRGEIDLYPEYTGTISQTILSLQHLPEMAALNRLLEAQGLAALTPFGFDNTYALAMNASAAAARRITRISDLRAHPDLRIGLSHEFRNRPDGWPGLAEAYDLSHLTSGIDHGLAYQAIEEDELDVTDAYSTDGDIARFNLVIIEDDRRFFPAYLGVPLVSNDLPANARQALERLGGLLDNASMRQLNARVSVDGETFAAVAASFLRQAGIASGVAAPRDNQWRRLWRNIVVHLQLTGIALGLACVAGIALALLVYRSDRLSRTVLYVSGLLQTIPSIALLALMIPLFGVGKLPAIVALFLYSLLPILRSTITALITIDPVLRDVARGMGLSAREQIRHVLLPLAMPNLLTGVKTAAIISIGTATLAAFIGAGGLGEPIVTGLALNDVGLVLQGAIPAAVLAIITEFAFELLERKLLPAHMLSR